MLITVNKSAPARNAGSATPAAMENLEAACSPVKCMEAGAKRWRFFAALIHIRARQKFAAMRAQDLALDYLAQNFC